MPKIVKTDAEWRSELSAEAYQVCRQRGTETPFSGRYVAHKEVGEYRCVCCAAHLFDSERKYDSGSGWPSFTAPATSQSLVAVPDGSHGMRRVEVLCAACDAHLGHVFDDGPSGGPDDTGQRYCINSAALSFTPRA